jgi:hypothetical protein
MQEEQWLARIGEMTVKGWTAAPELSWLEESYENSPTFWREFHQTMSRTGSWPLKSVPLQNYDFFHDLMVRHQSNPTAAFRWYSPLQGWSELTYARLSEAALERAAAWASAGVKPGDKICILLQLGVEFAVALLAALKLGGVVSCVPFWGRRLLSLRLKSLAPDHIVGDPLVAAALPQWKDRMLSARVGFSPSRGSEPLRSYSYASGETVGLLFDPSGDAPQLPVPLAADEAYLWPLREGRLVLGLRPGDKVAFPAADILETQPAVLFSVWMGGATYVHVEWEDLQKNPRLLGEETLHVLGVTVPVRDLLLRSLSGSRPPWRSWFRNPAESAELQAWQEFVDLLPLESASAINLRWRAALGGASLFSVGRIGVAHGNVSPSAGLPWKLESVSSDHAEPISEYGVLSIAPIAQGEEEGECVPTGEIIARNRREWMYLGMVFPARAGRSCLSEEVLAALESFRWPCSIVAVPSGESTVSVRLVLTVFTGASSSVDKGGATTEICSRIEKELGREYLPDRIVFLPLLPRRDEAGVIDHGWCRSQFLSGSLMRKAKSPLQRSLTKLRAIFSQ